jgi:3-hydroxybutyrate dehydrogenase
MAGSLSGKSALITGSTSGIGLAYARVLAKEGCDIMLNGFGDAAQIEATRAGLESEFGIRTFYNGADLRNQDEVIAMVGDADARLGKVDILVNNAGMQHRAPVDQFPIDIWHQMLSVNVTAAFLAIRTVLPQMKARDWGRIVNTASVNAHVGTPELSCYTASKHAILGLTKVVAIETIDTGITCNAICPGSVRTNLSEHRIDTFAKQRGVPKEEAVDAFVESKMPYHQPMKRFITEEEVAAALGYLCSEAGAAVRGTSIMVDGGWTAR